MNSFGFLMLVGLVFLFMLIFLMPKVLYFATLIYHVLFKKQEKKRKKVPYITLKDLKEIKSEKIK